MEFPSLENLRTDLPEMVKYRGSDLGDEGADGIEDTFSVSFKFF